MMGCGFWASPGARLDDLPEQITPEIERGLELIGLIGILDPARPEAKVAVQRAREAGIRTIMITGDHILTAEAIARDLGIIDDEEQAHNRKRTGYQPER